MLVKGILNDPITIGDECILGGSGYLYKIRIVRETKLSMGYNVWHQGNYTSSFWIDKVFWTSKTSRAYNNMYKI